MPPDPPQEPIVPPTDPPADPPAPPVIPPTPPVVPPEPPKDEPVANKDDNPIVVRYASKLKAELGKSYSEKFDAMPLDQRVVAMEAAADVLSKSKIKDAPPLKKGSTETPLGEPAPKDRKPKTTLQLQQEDDFGSKLRHRRSAYHRTSNQLNNRKK